MKHSITDHVAILSLVMAAFFCTSCIYDAPGDRFFRTLWKSSPEPLGPYSTGALTVEFLCDNQVTLRNGDGVIIAYGEYAFDGDVAIFPDLKIIVDGAEISFLEAHRNGDIIFLLWRPDRMAYPFTVSLDRLSAYE